MHALKRFGTAFGGYKMIDDYPVPVCGPDDIIIEIKAAAICGADMKHWQVDNGYDDTNITPDQQQSVRGHEFAGEIVEVGENVKDWRVGLSRWKEGFDAMAKKEAIKVIFTYDYGICGYDGAWT